MGLVNEPFAVILVFVNENVVPFQARIEVVFEATIPRFYPRVNETNEISEELTNKAVLATLVLDPSKNRWK